MREAFQIDPSQVDLTLIEAKPITEIIEAIKSSGKNVRDIREWIPVFGFLTDIFYVNKKLLIQFDDSMLSKLRQGNMKARMRMIVLYDLAQLNKGLVVSTDNYTEYLTGFWTLHGDVGDYGPIQNLWKTEVFNMSKFLLSSCNEFQYKALESCIHATPVDGLGISNSDCDQLGVSNYYEGDQIFASYFKGDTGFETHPIIQKFKNSQYKRENPTGILRQSIIS